MVSRAGSVNAGEIGLRILPPDSRMALACSGSSGRTWLGIGLGLGLGRGLGLGLGFGLGFALVALHAFDEGGEAVQAGGEAREALELVHDEREIVEDAVEGAARLVGVGVGFGFGFG